MDEKNLPAPQSMPEVSVIVDTVTRELVQWWTEAKLQNLTPEQLIEVAKHAVMGKLTAQMSEHLAASSQNVEKLVEEFLNTLQSQSTRDLYTRGLLRWLGWCREQGIHPLLATVRDADLFAASFPASGPTMNSTVSACASFYRMLLRWEKIQRTPFNRVARRKWEKKPKWIPSVDEVELMLEYIRGYQRDSWNGSAGISNELLYAAVAAMARRGFRMGALPRLTVMPDGRFSTVSKGKNWTGRLPPALVELLAPFGRKPFSTTTEKQIQTGFMRRTEVLVKEKRLLAHAYTPHDLRHHFASVEYAKDRDVLRVSKLLNHADVGITTRYLHEDLGIELK
jgi:site-specific recombinase XerD